MRSARLLARTWRGGGSKTTFERSRLAQRKAFVIEPTRGDVTRLARRWSEGDDEAFNELVELVYDDLRRIAHHHLDIGARGGTVDTTALVHEAYLKLAAVEGGTWDGRAQFMAFCSKAMRRILIDYARRRSAAKRGGERVRVPLRDDALVASEVSRMLEIEEALQGLERHDPRMGRIVECRFFGGMSVADTAEVVGTSTRTVEREWARERAYLYEALEPEAEED
jgi:RNA polymerase sigma factor (TIGR02999 family)